MELVYQDNTGKKVRFSLADVSEVLIGRHRDCNLRTDNPSVSRRHANDFGGWCGGGGLGKLKPHFRERSGSKSAVRPEIRFVAASLSSR